MKSLLYGLQTKPSIGWVELAPDDGTHYYQTERPKFFNAKNGIADLYRPFCASDWG